MVLQHLQSMLGFSGKITLRCPFHVTSRSSCHDIWIEMPPGAHLSCKKIIAPKHKISKTHQASKVQMRKYPWNAENCYWIYFGNLAEFILGHLFPTGISAMSQRLVGGGRGPSIPGERDAGGSRIQTAPLSTSLTRCLYEQGFEDVMDEVAMVYLVGAEGGICPTCKGHSLPSQLFTTEKGFIFINCSNRE